MSLRIKKLHGENLRKFRVLLKRPEITLEYLVSGSSYGFFSKGEMIAGFCLTHAPLDEMLSILWLPASIRKHFGREDPFKYAEITGYFLNSKKYRLQFKIQLLTKILFHKAAYFVYSYPTDNIKIEKQAKLGKPLRIYSGKPENIVGENGILLPSSINVDIISKWGVVRIGLIQAAKKLKRMVRGICKRTGKT